MPKPYQYHVSAVFPAATRRTLAGERLGDDGQQISVEEALRAHTLGAAASIHRENLVGTLERGKLADLVVLSADPVTAPVDELLNIEVMQTWVGGRVVFERDPATSATTSQHPKS